LYHFKNFRIFLGQFGKRKFPVHNKKRKMKNFLAKPPVENKAKPGRLGGPVSKYMATRLVTFTPEMPILEAISLLVKNKISGAPVLNSNREIVGMLDDKVCLRVLIDRAYHNLPVRAHTVAQYMDTILKTIPLDSDILDVATIFLDSVYKRLLVVDADGRLVGQISRSDALRAAKEVGKI